MKETFRRQLKKAQAEFRGGPRVEASNAPIGPGSSALECAVASPLVNGELVCTIPDATGEGGGERGPLLSGAVELRTGVRSAHHIPSPPRRSPHRMGDPP